MVTKSQISVNNVIIVQDNKAIHLDHSLNTDDKDSIVSGAIAQLWSSFKLFRAHFSHIQLYVQCKLFKQFCCSVDGVPLWLLSSDHVNDVYVGWQKASRHLSPMTDCNIVSLKSDCNPLNVSLRNSDSVNSVMVFLNMDQCYCG